MTDMFAPGATLRAAREKHNLTQADIAEATRIKAHIIDAIENNEFQRIATPLYAKGFIKMYAERVGLDPEPLIREYQTRFAQMVRPTLHANHAPAAGGAPRQAPAAQARTAAAASPGNPVAAAGAFLEAGRDVVSHIAGTLSRAAREAIQSFQDAWTTRRYRRMPKRTREFGASRGYGMGSELPVGKYAAMGTAIVVIAILLGYAVILLRGHPAASRPVRVEVATPAAPKAAPAVAARLRLAEEPPAPYLKPRKPLAP